jgi:transposase
VRCGCTYRASEPKPVIRRMAEELGVHHEALRNWIRQAEAEEKNYASQAAAEQVNLKPRQPVLTS